MSPRTLPGEALVHSLLLLALTSACGGTDPAPHVLAPGEIGTWAGTGVQGNNGDGLLRTETWVNQPVELAFAADGSSLLVDWNNHQVRRIRADGVFEPSIGARYPGDWPCQEPGNDARCQIPLSGSLAGTELPLNHPMDVVLAEDGSYVLAAWHNHKIMQRDAAGTVTVIAGMQKPGPVKPEAEAAATALFNFPSSVVRQADGSLLVADERNNRVRRVAVDGDRTITTVVGAPADMATLSDGVAATTALLWLTAPNDLQGADNPPPGGALALTAEGDLLIADTFHDCVRRIAAGANGVVDGGADETIQTVVGTCGTEGYSGDGDAATAALLRRPFDLELGPDGALYVADTGNHVVRRVDAGTISTIAGDGHPGFSGDDGPATRARLREPYGLAFDPTGDLFVVDTMNNRIRRLAR